LNVKKQKNEFILGGIGTKVTTLTAGAERWFRAEGAARYALHSALRARRASRYSCALRARCAFLVFLFLSFSFVFSNFKMLITSEISIHLIQEFLL
jgi:hypothetical protein